MENKLNKTIIKDILNHAKDFNKVYKAKRKKRKRLNKVLKNKYIEKFKKENKIRSIMN